MEPVDLDVSAAMFDFAGNLVDACFYNQLSACKGAVRKQHARHHSPLAMIFARGPEATPALTTQSLLLNKWRSAIPTHQQIDNKVKHSGDSKDGEKDGPDEVVTIDVDALPSDIVYIAFTVNVSGTHARDKRAL